MPNEQTIKSSKISLTKHEIEWIQNFKKELVLFWEPADKSVIINNFCPLTEYCKAKELKCLSIIKVRIAAVHRYKSPVWS